MGIGKKCEKPGQSGQPAEIIEDFSATLKMKGGQSGHNIFKTLKLLKKKVATKRP
jgi:hypothetical protein